MMMKLFERMGVLSLVVVAGAVAAGPARAALPSEFDTQSSFLATVSALDGAHVLHLDPNAEQVVYPGLAESTPTVGFGSATAVQATPTSNGSPKVDIASDDGPVGNVPEPGTWWLMLAGAGAAATLYTRRKP